MDVVRSWLVQARRRSALRGALLGGVAVVALTLLVIHEASQPTLPGVVAACATLAAAAAPILVRRRLAAAARPPLAVAIPAAPPAPTARPAGVARQARPYHLRL